MKIGLFFGSFNPIHNGHMAIAGYMAQFTDLDQVWFVVSPHNPFKEKKSLLKGHHRLAMVKAAIEDIPYLKASDIEFGLPQPSYTSVTLAYLADKYPTHEFALIMGSDNLGTFNKWMNYESIIESHRIYIYPRPGHEAVNLINHPSVISTEAPLVELSSTMIRNSLSIDKDARCFMPDAAWLYLDEMNFYK
ncbi:MAG: nicotinate-nucleotide adenylyltransferase [Bacteroidetes bacterium]|nr:nicotinate-nucleotide adenylyltransferase [Bacteroidota bacterium]